MQAKISDVCQSLVGETKSEKIWSEGEKALLGTSFSAVITQRKRYSRKHR
jgi:hypothetical protein